MEVKSAFTGKLWSEVSAIASSILTNLIYEELTTTEFELVTQGGRSFVVKLNDGAFGKRLAIILGIFFALWLLISVIVPLIIRNINRLQCRNRKGFRKTAVVSTFRNIQDSTIKLSAHFSSTSTEEKQTHILLYFNIGFLIQLADGGC